MVKQVILYAVHDIFASVEWLGFGKIENGVGLGLYFKPFEQDILLIPLWQVS